MATTDDGVFRLPGFLAFWTAGTVSEFGAYVTTIAIQVLVLTTLHGTAFDVGLINASRWVPYLVLGLVIGALVERRKRRPLLIVADAARGVLLALIPLLALYDLLSVPLLMVFVAVFGFFSLINDAAIQAFLPRLVPQRSLLAANARIDQSSSVAQTSGPAIGGALVGILGAPFAVLIDAATYFFSAIALARIRVTETTSSPSERKHLGAEISEGLRWVYRHRTLGPVAISTHVWFVFSAMLGTVFVPFVLLSQKLSAFELGLTLSAAGIGALAGSLISTRLGRRWRAGHLVIACYFIEPIAWMIIAVAPSGAGHHVATIIVFAVGQGLFGLALGVSNPHEMGYRQAVTPDGLQGRTNTTMRSFNRAAIIVGAPLGGFLAETIGYRPTLGIAIGGFLVAATILAASPFRNAEHPV